MSRTVIRGGTVLDGTGGPAQRADVLVVDGRIAEVGSSIDGTGAQTIDASGAYVSPGFIDMHTHLDPSLFWDPGCDPMPQHGVTTVLIGNCSLGLVPMRPELVDEVSKLFCYIEDMPRETFSLGIPWTWERYPEYRDALGAGGMSVNAAPLLGHSVMRLYVMGADAWERAATDEERAQIASVLDESMTAGAFGFSTSFFDADAQSRPVPSRLADDVERDALGGGFRTARARPRRGGGQPAGCRRRTAAERAGRVVWTARGREHDECARRVGVASAVWRRASWLSPASCATGAVRSGPRCRRAPSTSESTGSRRWCS